MSIADEDAFQMQFLLAKSAFQNSQGYLFSKFAQDALAKDTGRSLEQSAILRILNGLFYVSSENYKVATLNLIDKDLKIPEATVEQQDNFKKLLAEITS